MRAWWFCVGNSPKLPPKTATALSVARDELGCGQKADETARGGDSSLPRELEVQAEALVAARPPIAA